ncbi:site-2 protease family protein [bacterium]|nr:site-2 protease family protein [bacterium]MCP5462867.1 site-2 protease family protein [bacterium]
MNNQTTLVFEANDSDPSVYSLRPPQREKYTLHLILFVITLFTTTLAGATMSGQLPRQPNFLHLLSPHFFFKGLSFSIPLMIILLTHEMGHYIASRIHRVSATLPYFIPAPTFIGTFGAFIKMKSPILDKKALMDIGAAGPIAGFILSIPCVIIGLQLSRIVPDSGLHSVRIGTSLLIEFLAFLFGKTPPQGFDIVIHPIGFAGWIGLFVTSLNLIPIGQLDGGHIAYAMLGKKYERMSTVIIFTLLGLSFFWKGWLVWAIIIIFMGKKHPPAINSRSPLDTRRNWLGIVMLIIFIITFIPVPFVL